MMSGWFTKIAISLDLRVGYTHMMYHSKALIFLCLMIKHVTIRLESKKKGILNLFFHFYFLIQECSLNIALISFKLYKHIDNIHSEGNVSQNCNIGPSFVFM